MSAGRWAAAAGAAGLALSVLLLAAGQPWIRLFFYLPAWWFLLLLLAGLRRLRGRPSLLLDAPGVFLRMALFSVPAWLFYEALNLRLGNWEYWGLPEPLGVRWAGYALAFATVFPAVLEGAAVLGAGESSEGPGTPAPAAEPLPESFDRLCLAAGLLFLALPMAWPRYFFPLVWGIPVLLLEPWLARRHPEDSWFAACRSGRPRELWSLLASGLACGLLWEALNFWAGGKWRYTVPWPRGPKLFEMPLLGYGGFPPFALCCATLWRAMDLRWRSAGAGARWAAAAALAAFSLLGFRAMDLRTVRSLVSLPL